MPESDSAFDFPSAFKGDEDALNFFVHRDVSADEPEQYANDDQDDDIANEGMRNPFQGDRIKPLLL
ncbi:MAG: hypothetical protein WCA78_12075 [Rhizomicrobium sp.]